MQNMCEGEKKKKVKGWKRCFSEKYCFENLCFSYQSWHFWGLLNPSPPKKEKTKDKLERFGRN